MLFVKGSLPLSLTFLTFLSRCDLKSTRELVLMLAYHTVSPNYAAMSMIEEKRHQKSEFKIAPVSDFHDHNTIYDTMP